MSTNPRIYLDFNATAPLAPAARDAVAAVLEGPPVGNPSSIHAEGRRGRDLVERARNQVAALAGRPREQIVLASGGTEANALGVLGLAGVVEQRGGPRIVAAAAIDHPSLVGAVGALAARGWQVRRLPVDAHGAVGTAGIAGAGLVAVAAVNHELGTVADTAAIAAAARAAGALVHVDAVQAAGKLALGAIDADALALSAHKLGGPAGAGAVAIALDDALPLVAAGHHERGRRPGTENVLGAVGFGAAAAAADPADWPRVARSARTSRPGWPRSPARASTAPARRASAARSTPGSRARAASRSSSRSTSPASRRRRARRARRARCSRRPCCSRSG